MDNITIDFSLLKKNKLSISEYLTLYNMICPDCISGMYIDRLEDVDNLQRMGFIKITLKGNVLRAKAKSMFQIKEDHFLVWLNKYPIRVKKSYGGSRSLSPASDETIEGRKLRKKWQQMFAGNPQGELKAIKVLELEVAMRIKSNDLEFMVEATRWLNGGYHEKYEYLIEEKTDVSKGGVVDDYEEDWS